MPFSLVYINIIDLLAAVVLDWIFGDPGWFPHPVIYIGKLISCLEKKGRKICKTNGSLKAFGGLIVLTVGAVSFIAPFVLLVILRRHLILYNLVNTFIICTTISAKCLSVEAKKVYFALKEKNIEKARLKLSYIVGRDTSNLSSGDIIRADVETVAENTSDGVIAPLIYAAVFGAPLAMLYKGINTMDSMLGYMNERYRYIGFFPAKIDDVFNFVPARITGVLMCIMSFTVRGNPVKTFKIMIRDRRNHKSPNCAYPESAAAGALGVQLGGTNIYFGEEVYKPTIGDKLVELNFEHIKYCIDLMYFTEVLMMILMALVVQAV